MNDPNAPMAIYYAVIAVAVASSLFAMRLPLGKVLKMALAWVAIFGIGFVVFSFRSEFSGFGQRLKAEAFGSSIADGKALRIPMGEDGHYHVDATVNGHPLSFLVDSGASVTTISAADARTVGLSFAGRRAVVQTANGPAPTVQSEASRLEVGNIVRTDFPVDINDRDDTNLLGMNFLSSLSSWRVEGNYLVLQP